MSLYYMDFLIKYSLKARADVPRKKNVTFFENCCCTIRRFLLKFSQKSHLLFFFFDNKQQNKDDVPLKTKKRYILRKLLLQYIGVLLNFYLKSHILLFFNLWVNFHVFPPFFWQKKQKKDDVPSLKKQYVL